MSIVRSHRGGIDSLPRLMSRRMARQSLDFGDVRFGPVSSGRRAGPARLGPGARAKRSASGSFQYRLLGSVISRQTAPQKWGRDRAHWYLEHSLARCCAPAPGAAAVENAQSGPASLMVRHFWCGRYPDQRSEIPRVKFKEEFAGAKHRAPAVSSDRLCRRPNRRPKSAGARSPGCARNGARRP